MSAQDFWRLCNEETKAEKKRGIREGGKYRRDVWDERFIQLASAVAGWSKDPGTKVGCVIARPDKTTASVGFNGFPRGVVDDVERASKDRAWKLARSLHAEENAVLSARERLDGYTAYIYPLPPCSHCAAVLIQAGIKKVVCRRLNVDESSPWFESHQLSLELFNEAGVEVEEL